MTIRQILLACVTVMLLTTGSAWADTSTTSSTSIVIARPIPRAPEIDAASGTSAIALLTGVLLLVGESSRRRRS